MDATCGTGLERVHVNKMEVPRPRFGRLFSLILIAHLDGDTRKFCQASPLIEEPQTAGYWCERVRERARSRIAQRRGTRVNHLVAR